MGLAQQRFHTPERYQETIVPRLSSQFELDRCPHCNVHKPQLSNQWNATSVTDHSGGNPRNWCVYKCATCGGMVTAWVSTNDPSASAEWFPTSLVLSEDVPSQVARFLKQAQESLLAPDGAIMLAASAVDAMLKLKGLEKGSLNDRIDQAANSHFITEDMAAWAHDVRLDANDSRHVDDTAEPPTPTDAKRVLDFAATLAEILFVLPERVRRGRQLTPPRQP